MVAGGRWTALIASVALAAALAVPARTHAAIYWTSGGVAAANLDGSGFDGGFIPPNPTGPVGYAACEDVAVDASHVYWSEPARGAIGRANLDGSGVAYDFIDGLENPCGVAVDGASIYWAEEGGGAIGKAGLDGGAVDRTFVQGVGRPCGVAVGGGYLYWTADHYLARVPVSGGIPQRIYEGSDAFDFCGVAVDAAHVYWGGFGQSIGRAGLDGSDPEPSFIAGIERPCGIAVAGSSIYWTRNERLGSVESAALGGSGAARTIVDYAGSYPCGIAADAREFVLAPPPPPPLSHATSFWHSQHGRRRPATFIRVKFPQAGSFTVRTGPALRWRILPGTVSALTLVGPEERLLKIWPAARNRAARALRARLRRSGKAQVRVSVTFAAQDGTASTKREWLFLVDRRNRDRRGRSRSPIRQR